MSFSESRRRVQGGKGTASEYPSERHAEPTVGIDGCARYSALDLYPLRSRVQARDKLRWYHELFVLCLLQDRGLFSST